MPYQPTWNNPYLSQTPYQQAMVPQQTMPQMQAYQQPVNGITKVNGRDSALQYQLPPNSTSPALFDNNGQTFYVVSTDGTGMKTVEAFDFSPHVEQQPVNIDGAQFVSRKEYDEFVAKVSAALGALNGLHGTVPQPAVRNGSDFGNDASGDARGPVGGNLGSMPE